LQHGQPSRIEVFDDIADRLVVAAKLEGYCRGPFSARTRQQDLAPAQDKSIGRTQSFLDLVVFVLGERSEKNGFSHTLSCTTFPITFGVYALASSLSTDDLSFTLAS
jgi:hypothetical protein